MLIPLAASLVLVMEQAATLANIRSTPIEVRDLLAALTMAPLGANLAKAIRPIAAWTTTGEPYAGAPLCVGARSGLAPFNTETQRLYLAGAASVILGSYEAHHLAQAIGVAAQLHPERFTGFGFVASAWQQALRGKNVDH